MNPFDPDLQSLAWALIHFLWQGCLVWILTALALRLTRGSAAPLRYFLGILGLALCLALPIGTFLKLRTAAVERASFQIITNQFNSSPQLASPKPPSMASVPFHALAQRVEVSSRSYLPWVVQAWVFVVCCWLFE